MFKDLVLSRELKEHAAKHSDIDPKTDLDWHRKVDLEIELYQDLSRAPRAAVTLDYGNTNGGEGHSVRSAMLYYTLRRLGLDADPDARKPQDQQIMLVRREVIQKVHG